jgi:very-short-patch-repair endonuclease
LRNNQLGVPFRRQHPVGSYIVDLVCIQKKLVVELDGGGHVKPEQIKYDKARDQYLTERGFRIRRYFNNDVLRNIEGVLKDIAETLKE